MGEAKLHAKVSLLATSGPWIGQQMSQGTLGFTSIILCLPALCQTYSWKSLFLTGLLVKLEEWDLWVSHKVWFHSYFREGGWCILPSQSHMTESVLEYFSDFARAEPLISSQGCVWCGSVLLEARSYYQLSHDGGRAHQVLSPKVSHWHLLRLLRQV